ncbi:hypothetical protein BCR37DRAFT_389461 [Protomyces lactucae-debilis]|uniref:SUN domain-containing protein n=1 Tax=Protomyces lactucae-debilis TaxID=2754530 RepID=A0A1Y2EY14_PROLT|nr:uncharacterized protein BCR37DRAFT_389461 [Protomyces lactucae-debilis]ORY76377.1 hypothetical protein BCR37DRAFT_389461 [Protomyces lactucae-debilis]
MKVALLSSFLLGASFAAPAPDSHHHHHHLARRHQHQHAKRDVVIVYETVTVDKNGKTLGTGSATTTALQAPVAPAAASPIIPEDAVPLPIVNVPQAFKQAENLITAANVAAPTAAAAPVVAPTKDTPVAAPAKETPVAAPAKETPVAAPTTKKAETPAPAPAAPVDTPSTGNSGVGSLAIDASSGASVAKPLGDFVPPTTQFQDGKLACSTFPGMYDGVVALPNLGKNGYNSIQLGSGDYEQTDSCRPGYYCSYACQPGMSKTQWPEDGQPANGVSLGGLKCGSDGKLYLSRPSVPYLCQWDHQAALVENQASQAIAIGRTVYPGSENMVDPTFLKPGAISPLSVPDQNIFKWRGNPTSAQYYVNNAGISQVDGCAWGTPGSTLGNWAPMNFGAGYADGIAWLALIGNPNNMQGTNFKIKIVSVSGTMNGECGYDGRKYTGSSATGNGCTVACKGVCKFVMY